MWCTPLLPRTSPSPIQPIETLTLETWGKIGTSSGFGDYGFGGIKISEDNPHCAIYQRRKAKKPHPGHPRPGAGIPRVIRMRAYAPRNPRSPAQTVQRQKVADAVRDWQNLTISEKTAYNAAAAKRGKRGYDLYRHLHVKGLL